ncbi:anti-sigma factor domain-containing protein [Ideonella sp.]|uniref:anti-sigma factor domain-containing protein n=1 Tax=Ideonella sp. TaxID=1929293 RepID=UPI0035B08A1C
MNYLHPPRLEALARDYAVGTLRGRARRRFERVLREAPQARPVVEAWQQRLARLAEAVPAAAPRDAVWANIETRLFGQASPAPASQRQAAGWWGRWLPVGPRSGPAGAGLVLGVLAGAVLAVAALRWQPPWAAKVGLEAAGPGLPAAYVGILSDSQGNALVLASSRRQGQVLTIKWLQPTYQLPAGQVARLWALGKDGGPAIPVGALPAGPGPGTLQLPAASEAIFAKVDRLAVSLEPADAPPPAAPTQPFLAEGACAKLW